MEFTIFGINAGIIVLLLFALIIILAVITFSMSMRLSRLIRRYRVFMKGRDGGSMESAFAEKFENQDKLLVQCDENKGDIKDIKTQLSNNLTHVGIVKYDAFDDVGGKMSFALAMLNDEGSGFILNTIHSRDNCFQYLKEIVKGESYIMLTAEEIEALNNANSMLMNEEM